MMTDPSSSSSSSSLLPPGVIFRPTERQILRDFLTRKVHNLPLPNNAIVEMDVYDRQPSLYASGHSYGTDQDENHYFVRREQKSKLKSESAKNPKRGLKGEGNSSPGGWWKATTGDQPVRDKRGRIIGFKKTLKFYAYKNQKYDRRECLKTDWIMHEYRLPHPTFQEWVVCGIRYNGVKGTGQEYEACSMPEDRLAQAYENSSCDQLVNASSQPNIGSDGQTCGANACYFGECHSTLDNQQVEDSNSCIELIDDPSWNEFEGTEGSPAQIPQISLTQRELEDLKLYFDL